MNLEKTIEELVQNEEYEKALSLLEKNQNSILDESWYHSEKGWLLGFLENYKEALFHFTKAKALGMENPWLYFQIGFIYNKLEDFKQAEYYLTTSIENGNEEPWVYRELGWTYTKLEDYSEALHYFEDALMLDAFDAWSHAQSGFCLNRLNQEEEAIVELKKAISYGLEEAWVIQDLCFALSKLNLFEKELDYLQQYINPDEFEDDLWYLDEMGSVLNHLNRPKEALTYLEKSEKIENSTWVKVEISHSYVILQEYDKALNKVDEIEIKDAYFYYQKGLIYEIMEDWQSAYQFYQQASSIDKNILFLSHLAYVMGKLRLYEKAINILNQVVELGRKDAWIYAELACDYSELKQYDQAIEYYKLALVDHKNPNWILSELGWNLGISQKHEEAIFYYQKLLENDPQNGWAMAQVGYNLVRLDKKQEALGYYLKAQEAYFEESWCTSDLAWIYHNIDEYETALSYLEKLKESGRDDYWLHLQFAENFCELKKYDEAIKELTWCLDQEYDNRVVRNLLGLCHSQKNQYEEALTHLKQSEKMGEMTDWLATKIAWNYSSLKEFNQAKDYYEIALSLKPNSNEVKSQIAYCLGMLKKHDEALKMLLALQKEGYSTPWMLAIIGYNYEYSNDKKNAMLYYQKAQEAGFNAKWLTDAMTKLKKGNPFLHKRHK